MDTNEIAVRILRGSEALNQARADIKFLTGALLSAVHEKYGERYLAELRPPEGGLENWTDSRNFTFYSNLGEWKLSIGKERTRSDILCFWINLEIINSDKARLRKYHAMFTKYHGLRDEVLRAADVVEVWASLSEFTLGIFKEFPAVESAMGPMLSAYEVWKLRK